MRGVISVPDIKSIFSIGIELGIELGIALGTALEFALEFALALSLKLALALSLTLLLRIYFLTASQIIISIVLIFTNRLIFFYKK